MKIFFTVILLLLSNISAQSLISSSSTKMPTWIEQPPKGEYFEYFSGIGSSSESLENAKSAAISDALSELVFRGKFTADIKKEFIQNSVETETDIKFRESLLNEIKISGSSKIVSGLKKEEEYWQIQKTDNGKLYQFWVLLKLPRKGKSFSKFDVDKGYGIVPIWRSIIIPGWGQFYKGEDTKGWTFLASETILVSSIFITLHFSSSFEDKANKERDVDNRKFYNNKANQFYTASIISAVLAGAVYVYNIFDSVTAKGEKIYSVNSTYQPLLTINYNNQDNLNIGFKINF